MASELYIGLMSGTSLDGIDAGLVDFSAGKIQLISFHYQPFSAELRQTINQISQANQAISLLDFGHLDSQLAYLFAEASLAVIKQAQLQPKDIAAIGSHGQTIYHAPDTQYGFSLQIGDPNRIAELTGITTIADFRRRDIAAGGQGAPLVPAFHQAVFGNSDTTTTVLNIGGIANISILNHDQVLGFDTGPGNTLLDYWHQTHCNHAYDKNGSWASTGTVNTNLLNQFKQDDYFKLAPPKSTGKEYFSAAWLTQQLRHFQILPPVDVQATLCQLSADTIAEAINHHASSSKQVLVCGGGIHNQNLISRLQNQLTMPVISTAEFGLNPDHVEAIAFAWLARQTLNHLPGNLPSVTGAKAPVILGGIYLGNKVA